MNRAGATATEHTNLAFPSNGFTPLMKKNIEYHQESYLPALQVIDLCCFTAIGWQPAAAARDLI